MEYLLQTLGLILMMQSMSQTMSIYLSYTQSSHLNLIPFIHQIMSTHSHNMCPQSQNLSYALQMDPFLFKILMVKTYELLAFENFL